MKSNRRFIPIIIAACLFLGGILLIFSGLLTVGFDIARLLPKQPEEASHIIEDDFTDLTIRAGDTALSILPSKDGKVRIVSRDSADCKIMTSVEDGVLEIERIDTRLWYEKLFSFFPTRMSMTLYLPEREWGALYAKATLGIKAEGDFLFESAILHAVSGDLVSDIDAKGDLAALLTSGDLKVSGRIGGVCTVRTTSGDVTVMGEMNGLNVMTVSGDINASNLTFGNEVSEDLVQQIGLTTTSGDVYLSAGARGILIQTSSGEVTCEDAISEGRFEVSTISGDISLDRCDGGDLDLRSTSGEIDCLFLTKKKFHASSTSGWVSCRGHDEGGAPCRIVTVSGDVRVTVEGFSR